MIVNFGYVAMSEILTNASPSQTMTAQQFTKITNREDGLKKLERLAIHNIENCLRLLKQIDVMNEAKKKDKALF